MITCRVVESSPQQICLDIKQGGKNHNIWFKSSVPCLSPNPDACLPLLLYPGVMAQEDVTIEAPISPKLLSSAQTVQAAYTLWSKLPSVSVKSAQANPRSANPNGRVATFFTGGVDSFYTLLKNNDEIDTLIYVHGFDVSLDYEDARRSRSENIAAIAQELGKQLIEIETNLREEYSRGKVNWSYYHGGALAAVGLLLTPYLRRCYIAASHSYAGFKAWGSHPLLDPLWSTEEMDFVHDGIEFVRVGKLQLIKENPTAMRRLHVCSIRTATKNCCQCEKCMRTMMTLRSIQALDRCSAFEKPLNIRAAQWFEISGRETGYNELLQQAEAVGDEELARIIRILLSKRYHRGPGKIVSRIWREIRRLRGQPVGSLSS